MCLRLLCHASCLFPLLVCLFHAGQGRLNITQNNLSGAANRGCGCICFKTPSCCRRARFSMSRSRRERMNLEKRIPRSLSRRSMRLVLHVKDRNFGEGQVTFMSPPGEPGSLTATSSITIELHSLRQTGWIMMTNQESLMARTCSGSFLGPCTL
jgi:hypothetical protein